MPSEPAARSTARQCARTSWRRSRSSSTHRPRMGTSPSALFMRARSSAGVSRCPSSVTSTEKSSIASTPRPPGGLVPTETVTSGRPGRRAFHQSGTRTTIPAASSTGISLRNRYASAAVQASEW